MQEKKPYSCYGIVRHEAGKMDTLYDVTLNFRQANEYIEHLAFMGYDGTVFYSIQTFPLILNSTKTPSLSS